MLASGASGDTLMSGSSLQMEQSAHEPISHHHQFGASHVYKGYGPRPSTVPSGPSLGIFWSSFALIEILVSRKCRRFKGTFCSSLGAPPSCRKADVEKQDSDRKCKCVRKFQSGNMKERDHSGDLGIDRDILKWVLWCVGVERWD
jgi:hypothetical protein